MSTEPDMLADLPHFLRRRTEQRPMPAAGDGGLAVDVSQELDAPAVASCVLDQAQEFLKPSRILLETKRPGLEIRVARAQADVSMLLESLGQILVRMRAHPAANSTAKDFQTVAPYMAHLQRGRSFNLTVEPDADSKRNRLILSVAQSACGQSEPATVHLTVNHMTGAVESVVLDEDDNFYGGVDLPEIAQDPVFRSLAAICVPRQYWASLAVAAMEMAQRRKPRRSSSYRPLAFGREAAISNLILQQVRDGRGADIGIRETLQRELSSILQQIHAASLALTQAEAALAANAEALAHLDDGSAYAWLIAYPGIRGIFYEAPSRVVVHTDTIIVKDEQQIDRLIGKLRLIVDISSCTQQIENLTNPLVEVTKQANGSESVVTIAHPHAYQLGAYCLGEHAGAVAEAWQRGILSDVLFLLFQSVHNYNHLSPYRKANLWPRVEQ